MSSAANQANSYDGRESKLAAVASATASRPRRGAEQEQERENVEGPGLSLLPVPAEVMSLALLYAEGKTLAQASCVSKALRDVVTVEHWETAAGGARWLQNPTPASSSFESPEEAMSYWRRWSNLASGAAAARPGRLVVVGGNEISALEGSDKTEAFVDVRYGETIAWEALPNMTTPRSAAGAAVDRVGSIVTVGGWNNGRALNSCERLAHPTARLRSARQRQQHHHQLGWSLVANGAVGESVENAGTPRCSAATSLALSAARDQIPIAGNGGSPMARAAAGAEWGWEALPPLQRQRCFVGAAFEPSGALLAVGGGTGPYRIDSAFETVEVLRPGAETWISGPSMCQPRSGLGVTAMSDGKIFAAGGYGGNLTYLSSVEVFDPYAERWTQAAPMKRPRTGVAVTAGPTGLLYAVGGSLDGSHGLSSVETFDPREGKWGMSPGMIFSRAFCCAAFGASGCLYVVGGTSVGTAVMRTVEVFDPRSERWRVEERFGTGDGTRAITDASLVFQP